MKNILLINPSYKLEIRWIVNEEEISVKADYMPLGLATVAALTPDEFHVDIWDELVRGPIKDNHLKYKYDLVGVTSHSANLGRALELGGFSASRIVLWRLEVPVLHLIQTGVASTSISS